jgi:hypothetical protein
MVTYYTQPNFDRRLTTLTWPLTSTLSGNYPIQRGFMYWDTSVGLPTGYSKPAVVRFLFNPSTITTNYILQDSGAQAALNYSNAASSANLVVPLQQTCSFSLLFDRTYELWNSNQGGSINQTQLTDVQIIGVDVDVRAMRQFTGMYATNYTDNAAQGGTSPTGVFSGSGSTLSGVAGSLSQGIMQMVPSYLYFSTPTQGVMYYGYVDSWDVIYTHFTSLMIPMRCEVDVSFTFLPPPAKPASSAGAALIALEQQGQTTSLGGSGANNGVGPGGQLPTPVPPVGGVSGR